MARSFGEGTKLRRTGLIMILIGILGTIFDAIENVFIILMIFDPVMFPDVLAVTHSVFALSKYTCTIIFYGWILIGIGLLGTKRLRG
jgi:hypothetical protein